MSKKANQKDEARAYWRRFAARWIGPHVIDAWMAGHRAGARISKADRLKVAAFDEIAALLPEHHTADAMLEALTQIELTVKSAQNK
jgi:hypothetical protein